MRLTGLLLALSVALSPIARGQDVLNDTLSTLEQWVEMERRLADESSDWEVEKERLQDLAALYREELTQLNETIDEAADDVSAAEAVRSELNAEGERLGVIEKQTEDAIAAAEKAIRALFPKLPPPLQKEINPLYVQIPENPAETKLSIAQRIQFVVGLLTQIQKFNTSVTVVEDFLEFEAGNQVQIDAIYFGLGTAYYVDKGTQHAGYAVLGASGWDWQEEPSLAPLVRQVIEIYGSPGKAAFVELPVEIQ